MIRVLVAYAPVGTSTAHAIDGGNAGLLCLFAALAALAATGVAHLLVVSTPDPLSYLGWIIGLSTAAAVVVPLLGGLPMAAAVAIAIVNLVIGLAIGSLIVGPPRPRTARPPGDGEPAPRPPCGVGAALRVTRPDPGACPPPPRPRGRRPPASRRAAACGS